MSNKPEARLLLYVSANGPNGKSQPLHRQPSEQAAVNYDTCDNSWGDLNQPCIVVPLGWKRILNGTTILYISPSGVALSSVAQVRDYLQSTGTCKCGLPCPLRPENIFSFDPKVHSRPYQFPTGAELNKLCNHKRKLLASLSNHLALINCDKSKVILDISKRNPGRMVPSCSIQPPRTVAQGNNSIKNWSPQQGIVANTNDIQSQMMPPIRVNSGYTPDQMLQNYKFESNDNVNKVGNHYLTVNSGCINTPNNIKHVITSNSKQGMQQVQVGGQTLGLHIPTRSSNLNMNDITEQNKQLDINKSMQNNMEYNYQLYDGNKTNNANEGNSINVFGKQLTPEMVQFINQQQQIFLQQNQKQIEIAMKAYKTQTVTDFQSLNQSQQSPKMQSSPQGQLIIQNGAVLNVQQSKTPPWQVKKMENTTTLPQGSPVQRILFKNGTPLDKFNISPQISENNSINIDPNMIRMNSVQQTQQIHQVHCQSQDKKKSRQCKKTKTERFPAYNNMAYTVNQRSKKDNTESFININSNPSFMDDPTGYLAQQTVLLNNTISRQVKKIDERKVSTNDLTDMYNYKNSKCQKFCRSNTPITQTFPDSSFVNETQYNICQNLNNVNYTNQKDSTEKVNSFMKNHNMLHYDSQLFNSDVVSMTNVDDNLMISSTYLERNIENKGPIQGATVSTSNVSPMDTLQPPEPSPTPSNSSRNTDTPQSNNSGSLHISSSCQFAVPSPGFSNPGSYRDGSGSSTPNPLQRMVNNSPGPMNIQNQLNSNQFIHFHQEQNCKVAERDTLQRIPNVVLSDKGQRMPGYCLPPHLGGGPSENLMIPSYFQGAITTMAFGNAVIRDTITCVLAGKTNTFTTSVSSANNSQRQLVVPNFNPNKSYAIPPNQPDPFLNSVNLPTSYPIHIAGTVAQSLFSKSNLGISQSTTNNNQPIIQQQSPTTPVKTSTSKLNIPPGQILISSSGQIVIATQNSVMPPPAPKNQIIPSLQQVQSSSVTTNVTASVTQVIPAIGGMQQVINQPSMLVNTLPSQFVIQPQMIPVDGQLLNQNNVIPQIMTNKVIQAQPVENFEMKQQGVMQKLNLLSPDKKRGKKKKNCLVNPANVLQIANNVSNPGNVILPSSTPQAPQFQSQVLLVPGKTAGHVVMPAPPQINLLQPLGLPTFPQLVVMEGVVPQLVSPPLVLRSTPKRRTMPDTTSHMPITSQTLVQQGQMMHSVHTSLPPQTPPDTTTSPEPDATASAMVHCVSSSREELESKLQSNNVWQNYKNHDNIVNIQQTSLLSPQQINVQGSTNKDHHSYNEMSVTTNNMNPSVIPGNYYVRPTNKRKCEFTFKTEKVMKTDQVHLDMQQTKENFIESNLLSTVTISDKNDKNANLFEGSDISLFGDQDVFGTDKNETKERSDGEPTNTAVDASVLIQECKVFNPGELVWGPAKGGPWWPGKVYSVDGEQVTVDWFGSGGRSTLSTLLLCTLSEGLEAHHAARTNCRKSRKLNTQLEKAIQEAMAELDHVQENNRQTHNKGKSTRRGNQCRKSNRVSKNLIKIAPTASRSTDTRTRSQR